MVAWWVTLIIILVTLVFCAILIFLVRFINGKGSEKDPVEERKKDKCIQVHESQARLKLTTIVKSVSLSTQEEKSVTSETYYSVQAHLSKYQLDQFPWWSYMFVVVGGFMVCMILNYVVNRVNAARIDRYEELQHANDPDKQSDQKLKMPADCLKKSKSYGEVKEITLVFTQDENQRRGKEAHCSENVLVKSATSGYSILSIGDTQTINQTTRKPIQIKDSLILRSTTDKIFERELIDNGVETESVDLDLESESGDQDVESGPVCKTLEREPILQTIARQPVYLNIEREPVHNTIESQPVHKTMEREPIHQTIARQPVYLNIEREPVHNTIESQPVHKTMEREPIHQTIARQPVYLNIETEPVHNTIKRQPVPQTMERESVHLPIEGEPVHNTIERQPVPQTIERQPVPQTIEKQPVHQTMERESVHLPIEREPEHNTIERQPEHQTEESESVPIERESEYLTFERESAHPLVESVSGHLHIEREPVNVLVNQDEIKDIKLSASLPTLSQFEITNEVISDVRHYESAVSLSPCNEE